MDANEALRFKAAILKERGLIDTPVEVSNIRRALDRPEHGEPIGKKYFRTEEDVAMAERLRTSISSRVSARRLGISREQLRAMEQGRTFQRPVEEEI
jgi:hypothetical protein